MSKNLSRCGRSIGLHKKIVNPQGKRKKDNSMSRKEGWDTERSFGFPSGGCKREDASASKKIINRITDEEGRVFVKR